MIALTANDTDLSDEFGQARYRLYEAAFGEFMLGDTDEVAPHARAAEKEANALLREHVGLCAVDEG